MTELERDSGNQYRETLEQLVQKESIQDLNRRSQHLVESIKKAIEEALPKTEQIKKKWISKETLELIQQKRLFKLKRDESKEADTRYKKSCNDVKAAVREDKKDGLMHSAIILKNIMVSLK